MNLIVEYLSSITNQLILIMMILIVIYTIFKNKIHTNENSKNQCRFKTNNDPYFLFLNYFLGSCATIGGSLVFYFLYPSSFYTGLLLIILGVLYYFKGKYEIPDGFLLIKDNHLLVSNGNKKIALTIETIEEIKIIPNELIFKLQNQSLKRLEHLDLNQKEISQIIFFLKSINLKYSFELEDRKTQV